MRYKVIWSKLDINFFKFTQENNYMTNKNEKTWTIDWNLKQK